MGFNVGETVGGYTITEYIGQGGMATIYKAHQAALDRDVALKVIHPALKEDQSFVMRLKREAAIIAKLNHPNIVTVYDFSEHEGLPFLVLRFIEGKTLKAVLQEQKLATHQILNIVRPIADALTYAHSRGVLHRDVKPSNILIDIEGHVYLTDFGLARFAFSNESTSSQDMLIGSPHYISPEQAKSEAVDVTTDIYSLGIILYEMFTGRVPFSANTPYATILAQINDSPPAPRSINPKIPRAVELVLLKTLAKNPKQRYPTVRAMLKALDNAVRGPAEAEDGATALPLIEYRSPNENPLQGSLTRVSDQLKTAATLLGGNPKQPRAWLPVLIGAGMLLALLVCLVGTVFFAMNQNNPATRGTLAASTSIASAGKQATKPVAPTALLPGLTALLPPRPAATATALPPSPPPPTAARTPTLSPVAALPLAEAPRGKIAYTLATGDSAELHTIWVVNADGTEAHAIIDTAMWGALSPDGKLIAYNRTKEKGIYIANADGSNSRQILGSQACCAQWSPNGKQLVYYQGDPNFKFERAIYTANVDGTNPTPIAEGYSPTWSPDGNRIAYAGCQTNSNRCGLFIVDLKTKNSNLISQDNGTLPQWSPRGDKLVYQASDGKSHINVFVVNADGTNRTQLTYGKSNDGQPVWSSDGNFIFYRSDQDGKEWGIFAMRADGANPKLVVNKTPPDGTLWGRESLSTAP